MCLQDPSLIMVPPLGAESGIKGTLKGNSGTWASGQGTFKPGIYKPDIQDFYPGQYDNQYGTQQFSRDYFIDSGMAVDGRFQVQNSSFLHTWQTNGRYLQQVKMLSPFAEESGAAC